MTLLSRLQSKFGRYAVPNLTAILIVGQVFVYAAEYVANVDGRSLLPTIQLDMAAVWRGEVWRLVTFLFTPPTTHIVFAFFFWYMFYLMGTALEAEWGAFRYNVFLAVGYVAALVLAFATALVFGPESGFTSNAFVYGTVFLAFARLYPDFVLYIFFILPVKIKWLAWLQWATYVMILLTGSWFDRAMVAASVFNYFVFFGRETWNSMKHADRRMRFQARSLKKSGKIVHTCRVCGLSSEDSPKTQFRYCTQCGGDVCYCPEHLQNHEHVVATPAR